MPARRQRQDCPVCHGRKKTNQFFSKEERAAIPGKPQFLLKPCLKRDGRGYLLKPLTDAQRLRALERDLRRTKSRLRILEEALRGPGTPPPPPPEAVPEASSP